MSGNNVIPFKEGNGSENNGINCWGKPLEFILQTGDSWLAYIPEIATCGECKTYYEKKPENKFAYKQTEQRYFCTDCGERVMAATVAHPIHDGPFPMSGSGKCQNENVPYCPKCEEKPNFHGTPIKVEWTRQDLKVE